MPLTKVGRRFNAPLTTSVLTLCAVDPVTRASSPPHLGSFTSLATIEARMEDLPDKSELQAFRDVLTSWNPTVSSRYLRLTIFASPIRNSKADFLNAVDMVADIVEETCSCTSTRSLVTMAEER